MFIDRNKTVEGLKIWELPAAPVKEIIPLCRLAAAEGAVLLKNEDSLLPLQNKEKIAVFGRLQNTYYKCGTGSGGMVHIEKEPSVLQSLKEETDFIIDEQLEKIYADWITENPFDMGSGWAKEPWSQKEMPLNDGTVKAAAQRSDTALMIIGRSAGEDHDNGNEAGGYLLSAEEEAMIATVTKHFKRTVLILNVGNIIYLSCLNKYPVSAALYVWQGGMEGANALADILTGKTAPSGKLPDTQTVAISDHPSDQNFGGLTKNIYAEDIYVGYRYFETFAKEKVQFPFGHGITYTTFDAVFTAEEKNGTVTVTANITNTGSRPGKETLQVYYGAPCGALGNPEKQLIGYAKTPLIKPLETKSVSVSFKISEMASYDDCGATGNKSCYVLEKGCYKVYAGFDVRNSKEVLCHNIAETTVVSRLEEVMPPLEEFERLWAAEDHNGNRILTKKVVKPSSLDIDKRIRDRRPADIPYTGDKGIKLIDVAEGRATLDDFVAQLSITDLANIVCGEGMNSPKVTPGTGGALGGVTDSLLDFGIPVCCVTDGPSGIRMDSGAKASLVPNGALLASLMDDALTERLFALLGVEMFVYNIDALLGPGMNIHRHPLNGRNFEYFSEDPFLSGKTSAAVCRGISKSGCTATIKHFCGNNQETKRHDCEAVVSERALREIYLKNFEIAVKEGDLKAIMTAYNPVNGYWTSSNYDLNTTLLRKEWGYEGFVMTDWWARCGSNSEGANGKNLKAMVLAQNDIYMLNSDSATK